MTIIFSIKKFSVLQKKVMYYYTFILILISSFAFINGCTKPEQKRYVYIIGGAHKGERIYHFKANKIYHSHPWEILAIEANPYLIDKIPKASDTIVLNKAIWIKNGKIKFYFSSQEDNFGSVYEKHPVKIAKDSVLILIDSIDFGEWLQKNFTLNDYIFVTLDIEGAEYEVLNKMVKDNTIKYIDYLFVEFHPGIGGQSEKKINELLQKIKKANVQVKRGEM
ncbi:MAG: FkbM family methyltransferase [Syntrophaceae bacterium]|nr:FkbM family methyltransferase [Syntrophaceae bacterium]